MMRWIGVVVILLLLVLLMPAVRRFITGALGPFLYNIYRNLIYKVRPIYKGPIPSFIIHENYEDYLAWYQRQQQKKQQPNIAVLTPNLNKYTETFIRNQVLQLQQSGYYVHELYGGYLPTAEKTEGLLMHNSTVWRAWYLWLEKLQGLPDGHYDRIFLARYLKKNNIQFILVQYGTTAAATSGVLQQISIPFAVVFHGYDAWNRGVINAHAETYKHIFAKASAIIGVSADICTRLNTLGCPQHKIVHLPAPINTPLFTYTDHSHNPPVFLTVGRFAETKSPHLTILAFYDVLKQLPDARLVMIGKDGGGELFEACHILVRALGIQQAVTFKGICTPEQVAEQMRNARVFVQHSITTPLNGDKEGTPVSVMEAMASGMAIVATRHAGIAEVMEHDKTGLLVEEYNYKAMAQAMLQLATDNEAVHRYGRQAAEHLQAMQKHRNPVETINHIVHQYVIKK